jgi:hypothetical protein
MPIYYTEGEDGLFKLIDRWADESTSRSGIEVSKHTRVLIHNLLTGIREDPSTLWQGTTMEFDSAYREMEDRVPQLLDQLASETAVSKKVSIFDAMHWLSTNLDNICPIPKVRREKRRKLERFTR